MTAEPLLALERVVGGYGEVDILHGVDLTVGSREIVAVVGPNGAGKSTAMKAVAGLVTIRSGSVRFDGDVITGWTPDRVVRRGIGYVPQVENVFSEMTVHENLEMGGFLRRESLAPAFDRVYALFPDLAERRRTVAGNLSGGQRQMVAVGRALMLEPKLLLLDEPTAGLSPKYVEEILQMIRDVRTTGVAVLLVEQHAKQALALADRGYVLVMGQNRAEGQGSELLANRQVAELFLGG